MHLKVVLRENCSILTDKGVSFSTIRKTLLAVTLRAGSKTKNLEKELHRYWFEEICPIILTKRLFLK